MRFSTALAAMAAALFPLGALAAPTGGASSARSSVTAPGGSNRLSDHYIVVLKEDIDDDTFETHYQWVTKTHNDRLARRDDPALTGLRSRYVFGKFKGYSGAFDSSTIDEIRLSPEVDFVEENNEMVAYREDVQTDSPSWGLPRISQSSNSDLSTYYYDSSAGQGVTAYIIDTGINLEHEEFAGRATWGFNNADQVDDDLNGHGSHVSGIVAGTTYGAAKKVNLIAVKVLDKDGKGSNDNIIEGIQWVVSDAEKKGSSSTSVANMSLGGAFSSAVNRAVEAAINSGITFVVAAGNENVDASNSSPASASSCITVGSTDRTDTRSTFSNYGRFVDVFAPGTDITSAWKGSSTATNTISGTSMASPHVAGLVATLMSAEGISGASAVTDRVVRMAMGNKGVVKHAGAGSSHWLVYNGSGK